MPTDLENLRTRRSAILAELAAGSASKPTYNIDGQNVQWNEYRASLLQELKDLNELMASMEGPWEVESQMLP